MIIINNDERLQDPIFAFHISNIHTKEFFWKVLTIWACIPKKVHQPWPSHLSLNMWWKYRTCVSKTWSFSLHVSAYVFHCFNCPGILNIASFNRVIHFEIFCLWYRVLWPSSSLEEFIGPATKFSWNLQIP
jgi:hypothetical protein